jgi:hypothetical protein
MAKKLKISKIVKAGSMEFNWIAVGAGALVYMVLGFCWYSKVLFFPEWAKQICLILPGEMKIQWYALLSMPVVAILFAMGLYRAIRSMNLKGFSGGMMAGLAMAVCYLFMANSGKWFFANKPSLFWIDFGYQSISAVLMGGVIGKLQK